MTAVDSEIRARYLALALDARRILDVLVPFVESGERNAALDTSVKQAMDALNSMKVVGGAIHSSFAFDEYEQALTLDEVRNQDDRQGIIDDLAKITGDEVHDAKAAALRVLQFFFALESRALQHYNRPPAFAAYAM